MSTRISVQRFVPFIGYHHVLMILSATCIVLLSILLAGCTSESMKSVYLLSLSYQNATSPYATDPAQINANISTTFADLTKNGTTLTEVRAGYMGLCISEAAGAWFCSNSARGLADLMRAGAISDPLNLIWIAGKFKDEIVFNGLLFTTFPLLLIAIILLATFPGWISDVDEDGSEREVKPFPSKSVSQIVLGVVAIASILAFVSVFWQHIGSSATASMARSLSYGTVNGRVGASSMVFGWVGVFLSFTVAAGLLIMLLSIRVLSELVD